MKKIISYKTKLDENNKWHFVAITENQDIIDENLNDYYDLDNATSAQVNKAVEDYMRNNDIKLSKPEYMIDQKADLSYVRTQMRKIIQKLSNENSPLDERKEYLDIATAITQSSNVITKAVSLEISLDKIEKSQK